jgi:F0F1-type ATP synthase assembly protein I
MKPTYRILLIIILGSILQHFLFWWTAPVVAALVELKWGNAKAMSFLIGFYGVALPWMVYSGLIDFNNGSHLSNRVLGIFSMPTWPLLIIILTGLVGGLAGGFAGWAGGNIRSLFSEE